MPKLKTKKSAAKRIKVSGTGKLMRRKQNKRHILTKKSAKRKRHLGQVTTIAPAEVKRIKKLLIAGM